MIEDLSGFFFLMVGCILIFYIFVVYVDVVIDVVVFGMY